MRALIAMILAFPLYYIVAIAGMWWAFPIIGILQVFAGLNFD